MEPIKLAAFLMLGGFDCLKMTRIPNEYCPKSCNCQICNSRPWWLLEFENCGEIKIGWRKRVIQIDWSATGHKLDPNKITGLDLTKESTYIHAYGYAQAMEFLEVAIHLIRMQKRETGYAAEQATKAI